MTALDSGAATGRAILRGLRNGLRGMGDGWRRSTHWLNKMMPKGLYARALLIIIIPMVLLQSVIAYIFMERHWSIVTQRLSAGVVSDIGALIDVYRGYPQDADRAQIKRIAQDRLGLTVDFLPLADMPPPGPKPFFRCWTSRCRRNCESRSPGRSGSIRSANPRCWKFVSSSTIR